MTGGTADLNAPCQGSLMHTQTVKACTAESRNERRMDIDDPVPVSFDHLLRNDHHKACQNDQVDLQLIQAGKQGIVKSSSGLKLLG